MRGVKRGEGSTGRMKKHRYSNEFKMTAVKMATALDIETKAVEISAIAGFKVRAELLRERSLRSALVPVGR